MTRFELLCDFELLLLKGKFVIAQQSHLAHAT